MQVNLKKISKKEIELEIEVDKDRFDAFFEKAILEAGVNLEIKGFRKGNAPKNVIVENVGMERILNMAAEEAINESYAEALKQLEEGKLSEEKMEIISHPEINVTKMAKGDSLVYKAKAFILPEIDLPDYKRVSKSVKIEKVEVTKEEIENLRKQKENDNKEKRRQEIINEITKKTRIDLPEVLVQREQANILEGTKRGVKQNFQMEFNQYLEKIGKTEEQLLQSFKGDAEDRIKKYLILREISKKENLKAEDKELDEKIEEMLKNHPDKEKARKEIDLEGAKTYYKEVIENEKVFNLLEEL